MVVTMAKMKIQQKSIFQIAHDTIYAKEHSFNVLIPHISNNNNVFNIGFSEQISNHFPSVKTNYDLLGKHFLLKNPGYVQFNDVDRELKSNKRLIIATMISQNGLKSKNNKRPINYAYLVKSMVQVKKFMFQNFNSENKAIIYLPKVSFTFSGANWKFVECLIEDIWKDMNVIVYDGVK
jgi:hypothetical protein